MAIFNLLASNIINLELKLEGELPIDRNELLALINTWGRNSSFCTKDKYEYEIIINKCEAQEKYNLSKLDVSEISNFDFIFAHSNFNNNISSWDVSNSTSMNYMFALTNFNQDIGMWNVSNATSMKNMFYKTEQFNKDINNWNVSNVTSMTSMFFKANKFNQPLDKWDVSKVTNMSNIFAYAKDFNQNINSWNILKVKDMSYMFENTKAFIQPLLLDISHVESCYNMFLDAKAFKDKFNKGKELPKYTKNIKIWLIENRDRMMALNIEKYKGKELDNFLLNLNRKDIYDKNI